MSRAKTFVTGATGMTGSHTVQLLLKRGHTVRVLAHNEDERSMRLQELVFYGNPLANLAADGDPASLVVRRAPSSVPPGTIGETTRIT